MIYDQTFNIIEIVSLQSAPRSQVTTSHLPIPICHQTTVLVLVVEVVVEVVVLVERMIQQEMRGGLGVRPPIGTKFV